MYLRIEKLIGKENLDKIINTNVLIVGIGGVGGIALEMLVRNGLKNITIIDYDIFEKSNLNRQILCLEENLGNYKTNVAIKRMKKINKDCNICAFNEKLDENIINKLDKNYDYIIDACDDIKAKVLLIKFAIENNIKIISSCGMGNRVDPLKLYITDIWKTKDDPLAKKLRYELKKENIRYKLPVVASLEIPLIKKSGFVGSMAMVPNTAGILLASYVIKDIINK